MMIRRDGADDVLCALQWSRMGHKDDCGATTLCMQY